MNKIDNPNYVMIMGGVELDTRTLEGRRFLRNIFRMPAPSTGIAKELGYLTITHWAMMLDYIEEYDQ